MDKKNVYISFYNFSQISFRSYELAKEGIDKISNLDSFGQSDFSRKENGFLEFFERDINVKWEGHEIQYLVIDKGKDSRNNLKDIAIAGYFTRIVDQRIFFERETNPQKSFGGIRDINPLYWKSK